MPAKPKPPFDEAILAIANALHPDILGTGPLAMLRRGDPSRLSTEPALHRLLAGHLDDQTVDRELPTWTLLVHAMALAAPDLLRPHAGFGAALFLAGFSDLRMTRLLEARADDLAIVIPRAVRFLVGRGQHFAPLAMAHFVRGIVAGGDRAEDARTDAARDYYRAERNAGQQSTRSPPASSPSFQDAP